MSRNIGLLFLVFLGFVFQTFSQSKRVADRYFDEFAYMRAAKLYEAIYRKGDTSHHVLSRLANSYYNNSQIKQAAYWYKKLIASYKQEVTTDDLFRYAQSLRSNGYYKKSDSLFKTLNTVAKEDLVKNSDYLIDFSNTRGKRISLRNLSTNTPFSDFGGFLLNGDVYFASSVPSIFSKKKVYKWNNQPFLNIYKANIDIQPIDEWNEQKVLELVNTRILPSPVNTKYHEATPIITKDGKTMYFNRLNFDGKKLRTDKKKKTTYLKVYRATLVNGRWDNIIELPFNNNDYSVGHPALSPDEKTLYFVSDMPGGFGGTDIYKVSVDGDHYGTPVNLGSTINTKGKEKFVYIGSDHTLYFASDGHLGLGLLDIFQSKVKQDTVYTKPRNLGAPFNSTRDDFAFFIDETGKKGFFSSNRKKGKGDDDIYSFLIDEDAPELFACTQAIQGIVSDEKSKKGLVGAIVNLVSTKGKLIQQMRTKNNGSYTFRNIPCDSNFTVFASKTDYKPNQQSVTTTQKEGAKQNVNLVLKPLIIGNQIKINPIYFDLDTSKIREDAEYELENIVEVLYNHPDMVIKIESHTDSRGNKEYNRNLSDRRAKSTRNYIISRGINPNRIESAIGYGEDKLLNNCDDIHGKKCTEEQHQLNRRSYFYIVKGG